MITIAKVKTNINTAKSAWMVFSNRKLKGNTFLGGKAE